QAQSLLDREVNVLELGVHAVATLRERIRPDAQHRQNFGKLLIDNGNSHLKQLLLRSLRILRAQELDELRQHLAVNIDQTSQLILQAGSRVAILRRAVLGGHLGESPVDRAAQRIELPRD